MIRLKNDLAVGTVPHLLEPFRGGLLDERELAELGDYYFHVLVAMIDALLLEIEKERKRLRPLDPPWEN